MMVSFTLVYRVILFKINQRRLTTSVQSVVKTPLGKVRGVRRKSIWGNFYYSFEKIPFAKPPVGELRFKAPVPIERWDGELDCRGPGHKPMQTYPLFCKYTGSEDCLYLNVYAKEVSRHSQLKHPPITNNVFSASACSFSRPSYAL